MTTSSNFTTPTLYYDTPIPKSKEIKDRVVIIREAHTTYHEAYESGEYVGNPEVDTKLINTGLSENGI